MLTVAFNNIEIKRENSAKFLGVIIDENLIYVVLYRANHLLDFKNLNKIKIKIILHDLS